jgi:hypothetical protein
MRKAVRAAWWLMPGLYFLAGWTFCLSGLGMSAQDTRTVTEPVIPVACSVLAAQQGITGGEPATETVFDTSRIQAALNAAASDCAAGSSVELTTSGENNAFLIGSVVIPGNVTLVVDGGVTVFGSRNPADYQVSTAGAETCGTVGTVGNGCSPLISATSANSGLMGYGVIDGRGQDRLLVNGTAASYSWWDQAGTAQNVGGDQNNPILVMGNAANLTLYKITLRNSPMFHVKWSGNSTTKTGFTAWGVKVITPFTARNSDGIDPSGGNITITNSSLSDGDDMVAVSAASASQNITVQNTNTYSGHGISVGSYTQGGLSNMLVQNITQMGTAADGNGGGLRIKTSQDRGGLVQNVTYQNICSANVKSPIYLSPYYNTNSGTSDPTFSNITYRNVHVITEGTVTLAGYANTGATVTKIATLNFDNFIVDTLKQTDLSPTPAYLAINLGPGPVSPLLESQTGAGISYTGGVTNPTEAPYPCNPASFQYLNGELYGTVSDATNLHTAGISTNGAVTLNAMLQPAMSQISYTSISGGGSYTGTPAPTAAVQFLEGTNLVGTASLGGNGTLASVTLKGLTAGIHTYTAYYAGDTSYTLPLAFGSVTVTVTQASPTITTLTATPATSVYGAATLIDGDVATTAGATPTGQIVFVDNGILPLATVPLAGATAQTSQVLAVGAHSLTAVYSGDTTFAGSTSLPSAVAITQASAVVTLTAASASIPYGNSTTLTATVAQAGAGSYPTGTIVFYDSTNVVGSAALTGAGLATLAVTPGGGTHSFTARYQGDANYGAAISGVSSVVDTPSSTTTTETVAGTAYGSSTSISGTVAPSPAGSQATPTGSILFYDGSTILGAATVSAGTATITAVLAPGAHSITAAYSGDSNFAGSTSTATSITIVSSFAVAATPQTLSLAPGASGSVNVTVSPGIGLPGTVTLACASPVSYISCAITPSTQSVSGAATVSGTLTIHVAASLTALDRPHAFEAGWRHAEWLALLLPFGFFAAGTRRRAWRTLFLYALFFILGSVVSGCAGTPAVSNVPAAGTQVVTVTATQGIASTSTAVNVVVTN